MLLLPAAPPTTALGTPPAARIWLVRLAVRETPPVGVRVVIDLAQVPRTSYRPGVRSFTCVRTPTCQVTLCRPHRGALRPGVSYKLATSSTKKMVLARQTQPVHQAPG